MWDFPEILTEGNLNLKRKRYSEEKIISILKEHEASASVNDIARRHGIAENTIYRWKLKFVGMEVSEAKRSRELKHENAKLKRYRAKPVRPSPAQRRPEVKLRLHWVLHTTKGIITTCAQRRLEMKLQLHFLGNLAIHLAIIPQRRPELKLRLHQYQLGNGRIKQGRSTKAGVETPATRASAIFRPHAGNALNEGRS